MAETKKVEPTQDAGPEKAPETTTLDSDVTKPSVTAPGDGPADTTDPTELASTVTPRPGDEAHAAGTVNSVVKIGEIKDAKPAAKKSKDRFEEYDATKPNGEVIRIKRNIETGESQIISK